MQGLRRQEAEAGNTSTVGRVERLEGSRGETVFRLGAGRAGTETEDGPDGLIDLCGSGTKHFGLLLLEGQPDL